MKELKTLKDLERRKHFKAVMEDTNKWGTIPMIKMDNGLCSETIFGYIDGYELRQEAIKWVKYCDAHCVELETQSFLKHFFNLTSQEIKNENK